MDLTAYLEERAGLVEHVLDAAIPPACEEPEPLHTAMRHLLFPGGKRSNRLFQQRWWFSIRH